MRVLSDELFSSADGAEGMAVVRREAQAPLAALTRAGVTFPVMTPATTSTQIDAVAERLFRAFEANDADTVAALCDPDATFRQNAGPVVKMADIIPGFAKLHERIGHHRYVDVQRAIFDDGFVEEHRAVSTLPDGTPMDILACVVGRVGPSGKLVELHEYLDTAQRG